MTTTPAPVTPGPDLRSGSWRLDPARSSVEFHVRHFYGLMTVKGHFDRYDGRLDLDAQPAVELTLDGDSLDTKMAKRDAHLRSAHFFDIANHPQVRFVSDSIELNGETARVHGTLHAAGRQVPVDVEATLREAGDELDIEAVAHVDHRELGMTWSPLGIVRAPSELIVRGRLVRTGAQR
jgi:polyisoprenoid-binding protein YceI